ncbi:MAG: PEGA domain-containing protein [Candidatus Omnitrophota bacterium]
MKRKMLIISMVCFVCSISGCVRRMVCIDSHPQGAKVYFDRKYIGQTPCTYEFFFYGGHHLELVKEECANLTTVLHLKGPIYEYFPLSVFAEVLFPWELTDTHNVDYQLQAGNPRNPLILPIEGVKPFLPAAELERLQKVE